LGTEAAHDEHSRVSHRFQAALFLVEKLGKEHQLLVDIASSRSLRRESRLEAALVKRIDPAARVAIMRDIVASCAPGDPYRLSVLEHLVTVNRPQAAE